MDTPGTGAVEIDRWTRAEWWMLTVSCLAVALVVAAMAALYSALPQIAVETGATQAQLTWIVDGYTLVLACLVLPAGAIGDRYGRRGVLVTGLRYSLSRPRHQPLQRHLHIHLPQVVQRSAAEPQDRKSVV